MQPRRAGSGLAPQGLVYTEMWLALSESNDVRSQWRSARAAQGRADGRAGHRRGVVVPGAGRLGGRRDRCHRVGGRSAAL